MIKKGLLMKNPNSIKAKVSSNVHKDMLVMWMAENNRSQWQKAYELLNPFMGGVCTMQPFILNFSC